MRLPGPGRDQARVVERVDDLRPLARLVVDLLVRARGEEATRTSSRRAAGRAARVPPAVETMSCSAIPHSTNRSGYASSKARTRQSEARSASRTTRSSRSRAELDERLAVRVDDVLVRDCRPARTGAGLRLALERSPRRRRRASAPARARERSRPRPRAARRCARRARRTPARTTRRRERRRASGTCRRPRASAAGCSMNETPLPLIVRATSACGRSSTVAERCERRREAARDVVAVTGRDVPAERAELRLEVAERRRSRPSACPTGARCGRRRPSGLPRRSCAAACSALAVLPLLQLAVADHHDDAAAAAEVPLRPRDPAPLRDAHAERAGVRLDPRHCRRRDGRRARRGGGAAGAARAGSRRARRAPRRGPGTSWPFDEK